MKTILASAALLLFLAGCTAPPTASTATTTAPNPTQPAATEKTTALVTCDACGAQVPQNEITVVNGKNYCPMCKGHAH